jgi:uroporphyrinogen-III synthase
VSRGVLLTRQEGFNDGLATLLRNAGFDVLERPVLEVVALSLDEAGMQAVKTLNQYDRVIFISRNAVSFGMQILGRVWPQLPRVDWCAVGQQTADELRKHGVEARAPEQPGSDHLVDGLDWTDVHRTLIVRGLGGLERLRTRLAEMNIGVDYLEVYQRQARHYSGLASELTAVDIMVLFSGEALESICTSLEQPELAKLTIVVPSERVKLMASALGLDKVVVAGGLSDVSLFTTVKALMVQEK